MVWTLVIQLLLTALNVVFGYHSFERGKKHAAMFSFFVAGFCFMGALDALFKMILE